MHFHGEICSTYVYLKIIVQRMSKILFLNIFEKYTQQMNYSVNDSIFERSKYFIDLYLVSL